MLTLRSHSFLFIIYICWLTSYEFFNLLNFLAFLFVFFSIVKWFKLFIKITCSNANIFLLLHQRQCYHYNFRIKFFKLKFFEWYIIVIRYYLTSVLTIPILLELIPIHFQEIKNLRIVDSNFMIRFKQLAFIGIKNGRCIHYSLVHIFWIVLWQLRIEAIDFIL